MTVLELVTVKRLQKIGGDIDIKLQLTQESDGDRWILGLYLLIVM